MADFHLDHNVSLELGRGLVRAGHDVVTARDLGMERSTDPEHITAASRSGRILITHNERDFLLLHDAWYRWTAEWEIARDHQGLLIIPQWDPARAEQMVRELTERGESFVGFAATWRSASSWIFRG